MLMELLQGVAHGLGVRRPVVRPECPVKARQSDYSMIFSEYDEGFTHASRRLIELGLEAAAKGCREVSLAELQPAHPRIDVWPGEPYRLYAALTWAMQPKHVALGGSDRAAEAAVRKYLPPQAQCSTWELGGQVPAADLVIISGPGDGHAEAEALQAIVAAGHRPIVVIDGIKLWAMLGFWRTQRHPKLDMTSFGHWQGTGIVELQAVAVNHCMT